MTVRVAIAGPLSGPRSAYGRLITSAADPWMRREGLQCTLFDDQASLPVAIKVAEEIIEGRYDVVVGHFNSNCAMAVRPMYRKAGVPLILPASTAPGLSDGTHSFCVCADETFQVKRILEFTQAHSRSRPLVWSDGTVYGNRISGYMEATHGLKLTRIGSLVEVTPSADGVVVCLGHCERVMEAIRMHGRHLEGCSLLCCDDCFIDEFLTIAHPNVFVCGPWRSFAELLVRALEVIDGALARNERPLRSFFDESGRHRGADYFVYKVHRDGFRRVSDANEPKERDKEQVESA